MTAARAPIHHQPPGNQRAAGSYLHAHQNRKACQ